MWSFQSTFLTFFNKNKQLLKKHNFMFIDQITTLDRDFLLKWTDLYKLAFYHNNICRIPFWLVELEELILQNKLYS